MSLLKIGSIALSTGGGGGGEPTSMINPLHWESGLYNYSCPFTAEQIVVSGYESATSTADFSTSNMEFLTYTIYDKTVLPLDGTRAAFICSGSAQGSWIQLPADGALIASSMDVPRQQVGQYVLESADVGGSIHWSASSEFNVNSVVPLTLIFDQFQPWSIYADRIVTATSYVYTGTSYPYPHYASSTTGIMSATARGMEWWARNDGSASAVMAGAYECSATYADGPSTSISSQDEFAEDVTVFGPTTLQDFVAGHTPQAVVDTGYTYNFGASASSFSLYTANNS